MGGKVVSRTKSRTNFMIPLHHLASFWAWSASIKKGTSIAFFNAQGSAGLNNVITDCHLIFAQGIITFILVIISSKIRGKRERHSYNNCIIFMGPTSNSHQKMQNRLLQKNIRFLAKIMYFVCNLKVNKII